MGKQKQKWRRRLTGIRKSRDQFTGFTATLRCVDSIAVARRADEATTT